VCRISVCLYISSRKEQLLNHWLDGTITWLVSTTALSMGVDNKVCETVVHFGISKRLSWYLQEIGRCGRSSSVGNAYCIFTELDFDTVRNRLHSDDSTLHLVPACDMLWQVAVGGSTECRQRIISRVLYGELLQCASNALCDRSSSSVVISTIK
jgi:superfamily II DNA helicase RecQ